jgi:hypothetical protein
VKFEQDAPSPQKARGWLSVEFRETRGEGRRVSAHYQTPDKEAYKIASHPVKGSKAPAGVS